MKKFTLLFLLGSFLLYSTVSAVGFDLELSISTPNHNPALYSNVPITVAATNTGTENGTDIKIRVGICGTDAFGFVQQNQLVWANTGNASVGTWDWLNQSWSIPVLAPGQTVTLSFTLFTLTTEPRSIQVFTQSASVPDLDSTPGNLPIVNGLWSCTDNEDDEAVFTLNGAGSGLLPDLTAMLQEFIPGQSNCYVKAGEAVGFLSIQINNTGDVPATAFKVKFYISSDNLLSGDDVLWSTKVVPSLGLLYTTGPAFVNPGQVIPDFLANGDYFILVTVDEENEVAELNENNNDATPIPLQIGAPDIILENSFNVPNTLETGNSFDLTTQIRLEKNGLQVSPNVTYTLKAEMMGTGPWITVGSANFTVADFNTTDMVMKTIPVNIPVSLDPGDYEFRVFVGLNTCEAVGTNNFMVQAVTVTEGTGNYIDLELGLSPSNMTPAIYTYYQLTATLKNTGSQAATGVKVSFKKPPGVVYQGGNEYMASQGSFSPNGNQTWTVGNIPSGGLATLTVNYFLLQYGAPGAYAQVIAANEPDIDSTPNNGTPPSINEDDEAATGDSPPPVLTPDLFINNLKITNSPIQPGQVLTYNFDLANIGNGAAPDDFVVKAWISEHSYFNTNGIQDGIVPTGNFNAGFSVTGVPGASTIPATLPEGQYYLHLLVDADDAIQESNETNNTLSGRFIVLHQQQPGECDEFIGTGNINCTTHNTAGQLQVIYQPNGELFQATLDGTGQVVADHYAGQKPPDITFSVEGFNLVKRSGNNEVYRIAVPPSLADQYERFAGFTEYQGGYLIFGFEQLMPIPAPMVAIKTTPDFDVLQTNVLNIGEGPLQLISSALEIPDDEVAIILNDQYTYNFNRMRLIILDDALTVKSDEVLAENNFGATAKLYPNFCGNYSLDIFRQISFCRFGSCYEHKYRDGHFENGAFVIEDSYEVLEYTSFGVGTRSQLWTLATEDGGIIKGTHAQALPVYGYPVNNVIHLTKTLGNIIVWEKEVAVANASVVRRLAMSEGELAFLSEKIGGFFVETLSCLEDNTPTGCDAITITPTPGQITIAGAKAPHVLIKVFRPNWTVAFECLDNCTDPLIVDGLNAGSYFVEMKLLDASWEEICKKAQTINVPSFVGGSNALMLENTRQRMVFDHIYPNPSKYWVTLDIYSKDKQLAVIDFYNQQGQTIHRMEVEVKTGRNKVELDVSQWRSSSYYIIGRGNGTPAYGRFLKVWE